MEWQPISTAPKDGTRIIIGTKVIDGSKGRVFFHWFYECGEWGDTDDVAEDVLYDGEFISHWMPLPEPPEA